MKSLFNQAGMTAAVFRSFGPLRRQREFSKVAELTVWEVTRLDPDSPLATHVVLYFDQKEYTNVLGVFELADLHNASTGARLGLIDPRSAEFVLNYEPGFSGAPVFLKNGESVMAPVSSFRAICCSGPEEHPYFPTSTFVVAPSPGEVLPEVVHYPSPQILEMIKSFLLGKRLGWNKYKYPHQTYALYSLAAACFTQDMLTTIIEKDRAALINVEQEKGIRAQEKGEAYIPQKIHAKDIILWPFGQINYILENHSPSLKLKKSNITYILKRLFNEIFFEGFSTSDKKEFVSEVSVFMVQLIRSLKLQPLETPPLDRKSINKLSTVFSQLAEYLFDMLFSSGEYISYQKVLSFETGKFAGKKVSFAIEGVRHCDFEATSMGMMLAVSDQDRILKGHVPQESGHYAIDPGTCFVNDKSRVFPVRYLSRPPVAFVAPITRGNIVCGQKGISVNDSLSSPAHILFAAYSYDPRSLIDRIGALEVELIPKELPPQIREKIERPSEKVISVDLLPEPPHLQGPATILDVEKDDKLTPVSTDSDSK